MDGRCISQNELAQRWQISEARSGPTNLNSRISVWAPVRTCMKLESDPDLLLSQFRQKNLRVFRKLEEIIRGQNHRTGFWKLLDKRLQPFG